MKYANPFFCVLLLASMGGIGACAFNVDRVAPNYDGSEPVGLVATDGFLPVGERDETGRQLPYQPMPNPYSALEGQVDKDAVDRYIAARRAFNEGQYVAAEKLLTELAGQEQELSGPFVMRGDIAVERNDLEQAVEHYISALEINPINFNAYLRLARVQRMRGHFHHAQNTYAQALERWPDGAEIHLNLGILYDLYLNKPLKAQAHMEAYQLIKGSNSGKVVQWLEEIRQRTGVATALTATAADQSSEPQLSRSPDKPEE